MRKPIARRLLDLTPLLDVIMILLFGTMINSVEITKAKNDETRKEFAKLALSPEQIKELQMQLEESRAQQKVLTRRLELENNTMKETIARLIGLNERDRLSLEERTRRLAESSPEEAARLLKEMSGEEASADLVLGLRRLEEMEKVFTFVDLHIDKGDFLAITSDGKPLARFSVREPDSNQIQSEIRRALESLRLNEVVLMLFSYDGDARDRVVERTEAAVNTLLNQYRQDPGQRGRQFRLGRVGLLTDSPPTPKGK